MSTILVNFSICNICYGTWYIVVYHDRNIEQYSSYAFEAHLCTNSTAAAQNKANPVDSNSFIGKASQQLLMNENNRNLAK